MSQNLISADLDEKVKSEILTQIKNLNALMPFLTKFDSKDGFVMMGDKTIAFVEKAIELAKNNPALVPSYIETSEMEKDFHLSRDLSSIATELATLLEKIRQTSYAAGSDAYNTALQFYTSSKAADKAGVPGMNNVVTELSKRFPAKRQTKPVSAE